MACFAGKLLEHMDHAAFIYAYNTHLSVYFGDSKTLNTF